MEDMELVGCMIVTEIMKLNFAREKAKSKGQQNRLKALTQQVLGLKKSLQFIKEVQELEE